MKRLIFIHGMKRSGNHAIINWLKAHDRFIFLNNVLPIAPILAGEKTIPPPEDFMLWLQRKLLPKIVKDHFFKENELFAFFLKKFALQNHSLIISLEDHELDVSLLLNVPCDVSNILILRDPFNLFSSRIRKASSGENPAYPRDTGPAMDRVLKLWKSHAREYLGLTNHLENKVCIYFNSWFSEQHYRQSISQKLNLEFTDIGFSQVSQIGLGSSFDGTEYNGKNQKMDVLNRKKLLNDSESHLLEKILADKELQELGQRIISVT